MPVAAAVAVVAAVVTKIVPQSFVGTPQRLD
jgi:hypothetical protein